MIGTEREWETGLAFTRVARNMMGRRTLWWGHPRNGEGETGRGGHGNDDGHESKYTHNGKRNTQII